jgi:hypothetical protein
MARRVKLNELDSVLSHIDYPIAREAAIEATDDVIIELADGETNFGQTLTLSSEDSFASADELSNELMSLLPRNAVGEPYQSEGEG